MMHSCAGNHTWKNILPSEQVNLTHLPFQSREAPSQVNHSHLVGMGQLLWFRDHRDMAATGHDHLLVLFQERLEHTWSECGLNKQLPGVLDISHLDGIKM